MRTAGVIGVNRCVALWLITGGSRARAPHAAHVIADAAVNTGADLIVVGARGHTKLLGFVLGSVTHRLMQIATCPVLTVPPADRHRLREAGNSAAAVA